MADKIQILGGAYQTALGSPLNHGQVLVELNTDEVVTTGGQVVSGIKVKIPLDSQGDAMGTNSVLITSTSVLENVLYITFPVSVLQVIEVGDNLVFPTGLVSSYLDNKVVSVSTISDDGLIITAPITHSDYTAASETMIFVTIGEEVLIWPNDAFTVNTFYIVNVYSDRGQHSWGPFYGTIDSPSPFSMDTWVPSQLG